MQPVLSALSNLTDHDLTDIVEATSERPPLGPPTLLAWLAHAVRIERERRKGVTLAVMEPSSAIANTEEVEALAATIALRNAASSERVSRLYTALIDVMSVGTRH